jgi:hypothetical protein
MTTKFCDTSQPHFFKEIFEKGALLGELGI